MQVLTILVLFAAVCITDVLGGCNTRSAYPIDANRNVCWGRGRGGKNKFCGAGNYCCRKGFKDCPSWIANNAPGNHHTCMRVSYGRTAYAINARANVCWGRGGGGMAEKACGLGNYCCRKGHKDCPSWIANNAPGNHHTCMRVVNRECTPLSNCKLPGGCGSCQSAWPIDSTKNVCWGKGKGGLNSYCGKGNYCCRRGFKDCPSWIAENAPGNHHTCMKVTKGKTAYAINSRMNVCWGKGRGGKNAYCGAGNYCCRKGFKDCPSWISNNAPGNHHTCMRVVNPNCKPKTTTTTTTFTHSTWVWSTKDEKKPEEAVKAEQKDEEAKEPEEEDEKEEEDEQSDEQEEEKDEEVADEESKEPESVEDEEEAKEE